MAATDPDRTAWSRDIEALLGTRIDTGMQFWNLLKNLECHKILEQYLEDKTRTEFTLTLAPLGVVTLRRCGTEWDIVSLNMSKSFKDTLNETLRCEESNLHRELYDRNMTRLTKYLQQYSESQRT